MKTTMMRSDDAAGTICWKTPVGWMKLWAGEKGIRRIAFHPRREALCGDGGQGAGATEVLQEARRQIEAYFGGERRDFDLPLDLAGLSPFSAKVLHVLAKVPFGTTVSYGELARLAGSAGAARAVGRALAINPLPIVLPCHRVVATSGRLCGYSGGEGLVSKRWLLDFERSESDRDSCSGETTAER